MADTLIVIPTYNERENIVPITEAVLLQGEEYHILFVDDHSPDGTQAEIEKMMQKYPSRVYLLGRSGKLGLGTAYIAGFKWALERHYEFIFEMDSDFSHDPKDINRLKKRCLEGSDLCYRRKALESIDLEVIEFKGYAFQICMKYAVAKKKLKIQEVPITFKDRLYGESKMSSGIFKEALFGVWKMKCMRL